jgi:DnaJ-class molecular chaperone
MPCAADPSRRGNLHVRLHVQFPTTLGPLTDAQRAVLRQALS